MHAFGPLGAFELFRRYSATPIPRRTMCTTPAIGKSKNAHAPNRWSLYVRRLLAYGRSGNLGYLLWCHPLFVRRTSP